jgi:imidazolonepropionase-like amidohydrolase
MYEYIMSALLSRSVVSLTMNQARDVIADGAVLADEGCIAYVGPAVGAPVDHNAEVIDATGKPVLPGLVGDGRLSHLQR